MKEYLFHVTSSPDIKFLEPRRIKDITHDECICFSKNVFVSAFGDWIYMFDYQTMENDFSLKRIEDPGSFHLTEKENNLSVKFVTKPLSEEYRIHVPVSIEKYCIGKFQHYDLSKGYIEIYNRLTNTLKIEKENGPVTQSVE